MKSVHLFIYIGNNISSPASDINSCIGKTWTAIDSLSSISESDLSYEIKRDFFQVGAVSVLLFSCTTWTLTTLSEKKARWKRHQTSTYCFERILEAASNKTTVVQPFTFISQTIHT